MLSDLLEWFQRSRHRLPRGLISKEGRSRRRRKSLPVFMIFRFTSSGPTGSVTPEKNRGRDSSVMMRAAGDGDSESRLINGAPASPDTSMVPGFRAQASGDGVLNRLGGKANRRERAAC